jgi:hypothetical protein
MSNAGILPGNDFVMQQTEGGEGTNGFRHKRRRPFAATANDLLGWVQIEVLLLRGSL